LSAAPDLGGWLSNSATGSSIDLYWSLVPGATEYAVDRSGNGGKTWKEVVRAAGDVQSWQDTKRAPATPYCYRVRTLPVGLAPDSSTICVTTPIVYELEELPYTLGSGKAVVKHDAAAGSKNFLQVSAGDGGWIEFNIPVDTTGTYQLCINHTVAPNNARWQLFLDGESFGEERYGYSETFGFEGPCLGTFEVMTAPTTKTVRFQVTGKADESTSYKMGLDALTLSVSGAGRFEAESATPAVSKNDSQESLPDSQASGGQVNVANLNAIGDHVRYTLDVPCPGDYLVVVRIRRDTNQGQFQVSLDDVPVGIVDGYAATSEYAVLPLISEAIASKGNHKIKFAVTGKNTASSGYGIAVDWIELQAAGSKDCVGKTDGTVCSDGDACSLEDTCLHGTCTATARIECPQYPKCQVPSWCQWENGQCTEPQLCAVCGNGIQEIGEECDDGNAINGDGCAVDCRKDYCGDGVRKPILTEVTLTYLARSTGSTVQYMTLTLNGVEVARAPLPQTDSCQPGIGTLSVPSALLAETGKLGTGAELEMRSDGEVAWIIIKSRTPDFDGEWVAFDANGGVDGDNRNPDLCAAGTQIGIDGVWSYDASMGEECDDGNTVDDDSCTNACKLNLAQCTDPTVCPACGNHRQEAGEQCDDGNTFSGDGCTSTCRQESCGDGITQGPVSYLTIKYLARSCNQGPQDIYFTVNDVEVGRAPLPETCDCQPPIATVQLSDPALLGQIHVGDTLTVILHTQGEVAWSTLEVHGSSWAELEVLFDANDGGDAVQGNPDLCLAGSFNGPDGVGIAGTMIYGEECDDGNTVDTDGCTNDCRIGTPAIAVSARMMSLSTSASMSISTTSTSAPAKHPVLKWKAPKKKVMTKRIVP
jgi:cysteine-rich repeat protein